MNRTPRKLPVFLIATAVGPGVILVFTWRTYRCERIYIPLQTKRLGLHGLRDKRPI